MSYMQPEALGWRPLLQSWLQQLPPSFTAADAKPPLNADGSEPTEGASAAFAAAAYAKSTAAMYSTLFDWLIDPALSVLRTQCRCGIALNDVSLVAGTLRLLRAFLDQLDEASEEEGCVCV